APQRACERHIRIPPSSEFLFSSTAAQKPLRPPEVFGCRHLNVRALTHRNGYVDPKAFDERGVIGPGPSRLDRFFVSAHNELLSENLRRLHKPDLISGQSLPHQSVSRALNGVRTGNGHYTGARRLRAFPCRHDKAWRRE